MIPEWCKRAATDINRNMGTDPDVFDSSVAEDAAILAKHAPDTTLIDYDRANFARQVRAQSDLEVRELVEAARQILECDFGSEDLPRLRRALEPFKEVS